MNLQYSLSKNNERTFSIDSILYHSSYNPSREAERFIQTYNFTLSEPDLIILIEPGFSYLYDLLKKKFPDSKIGIIRLIENFDDCFEWDFILNPDNLENELKSKFTETELLNSEVIIWPPSLNIFSESIKSIISIYSETLKFSKLLLTTRQYFEKKWVINTVNCVTFAKNIYQLKDIELPIVITASGPSLRESIKTIEAYRNNFFLIALSSSLSVLIKNDIVPDLVLSTDGGFYANEHIKILEKVNIPLVISSESYISKKILEKNPLIILNYNDGVSSQIISKLQIPSISGERNGTVSGTALSLAKTLTKTNIYFCGLDLNFVKGFQHTQPNVLEINDSLNDYKISSKENRITKREMNKDSLKIYRDWFSQLKDTTNIYRVIENDKPLGQISDISFATFENKLSAEKTLDCNEYFYPADYNNSKAAKLLMEFFSDKNFDVISEQIFPGDYLAIKHNPPTKEKLLLQLSEKKQKLISKIRKILNG